MLLTAAATLSTVTLAALRARKSWHVMQGDAAKLKVAQTVEPTDKQLKAIRQALRENDVLCFGDSDHSAFAIKAFVLHPKVRRVFAEEGVADLCLELSPSGGNLAQDYARGRITKGTFDDYAHHYMVGSFVHGVNRRYVASRYERFISRGGPMIHGVDTRPRGRDTFQDYFDHKLTATVSKLCGRVVQAFIEPRLHPAAFAMGIGSMLNPRRALQLMGNEMDDAAAAARVLAIHQASTTEDAPQKTVLVYGYGHLSGMPRAFGHKGLNDHLKDAGLKVGVIPLFVDTANMARRVNEMAEFGPALDPVECAMLVKPAKSEMDVVPADQLPLYVKPLSGPGRLEKAGLWRPDEGKRRRVAGGRRVYVP